MALDGRVSHSWLSCLCCLCSSAAEQSCTLRLSFRNAAMSKLSRVCEGGTPPVVRSPARYMRWRSFDGELKKILEQSPASKGRLRHSIVHSILPFPRSIRALLSLPPVYWRFSSSPRSLFTSVFIRKRRRRTSGKQRLTQGMYLLCNRIHACPSKAYRTRRESADFHVVDSASQFARQEDQHCLKQLELAGQ